MESGRVDLFLGMDERLHTPPQRSRLGKTGFLDLYSTLFWWQLVLFFTPSSINPPSTNQLRTHVSSTSTYQMAHSCCRWQLGAGEPIIWGDTQLCLFPNTSVDPVGPLSSTVPGQWQQIACEVSTFYSALMSFDNLESSGRVTRRRRLSEGVSLSLPLFRSRSSISDLCVSRIHANAHC